MTKIEKLKQLSRHAKELYRRYEGIIEVYQTGKDVSDRVVAATENALNLKVFTSSNDELNAIKEVASKSNNTLIKLLLKDETGWLEWSGVNAFDKSAYNSSRTKLEQLNRELKNLIELSESLVPLAYSLTAIQGWQDRLLYAYVPSLAAIEYGALDETLKKLKAIQTNANIINKRIEAAISSIDKHLISATANPSFSTMH